MRNINTEVMWIYNPLKKKKNFDLKKKQKNNWFCHWLSEDLSWVRGGQWASQYWSLGVRSQWECARDCGTHLPKELDHDTASVWKCVCYTTQFSFLSFKGFTFDMAKCVCVKRMTCLSASGRQNAILYIANFWDLLAFSKLIRGVFLTRSNQRLTMMPWVTRQQTFIQSQVSFMSSVLSHEVWSPLSLQICS